MNLLLAITASHAECLSTMFVHAGHVVEVVMDGLSAWNAVCEDRHDLLVLEEHLTALNGLDLVRRLRLAGSRLPVLMVGLVSSDADHVQALDAGADDFLAIPVSAAVLMARTRALARRGLYRAETILTVGDLAIDTRSRTVTRGDVRIPLAPKEYQALEYLAAKSPQVVSREELFRRLHPDQDAPTSNAVDVLMGRLRRKLMAAGVESLLQTRRGAGYHIDDA